MKLKMSLKGVTHRGWDGQRSSFLTRPTCAVGMARAQDSLAPLLDKGRSKIAILGSKGSPSLT